MNNFIDSPRKLDRLLAVQPCARPKDAEMSVTQFLPLKNALRISQCKGQGSKWWTSKQIIMEPVEAETQVWSVGVALSSSSACRMGKDLLATASWAGHTWDRSGAGGRVLLARVQKGFGVLETYIMTLRCQILSTHGQWKGACQSAAAYWGLQWQSILTSLSLPLFPTVTRLCASLGGKGQGPWNPLPTLPRPL